jgi:ketosteroid isomerase-like protein
MPPTNTLKEELNMNWAESPAPDEAEITALNQRLAAALRARDINAVMSAYAHDEILVFDAIPPRQHIGAKELGRRFQRDQARLLLMSRGVGL